MKKNTVLFVLITVLLLIYYTLAIADFFSFDASGRLGWNKSDYYIYLVDISPTGQITMIDNSGIIQYGPHGETNWRVKDVTAGGLASDHEGNIFGLINDCVLASYDQAGIERWSDKLADASPTYLATDSDDNVYALCEKHPGGINSDTIHVITKCSPDGEILWQQTAKTPGESVQLFPFIEKKGNTYILSVNWDYQESASSVMILKYDSSGNSLWKIELNHCDYGVLAGNQDDAIFVLENCEEGQKLVMYGHSGYEQWRRDFADNLLAQYLTVVFDGGPIVLGIDTSSGEQKENHIIRYDKSGQTIFDVSYDYLLGGIGWPIVDRYDNIYAMAVICDKINGMGNCILYHNELQKFDSAGDRSWNTVFGANSTRSLDTGEDAVYVSDGISNGLFLSPSLWPSSDDDATDDDIVPAGGGDNSGCGC